MSACVNEYVRAYVCVPMCACLCVRAYVCVPMCAPGPRRLSGCVFPAKTKQTHSIVFPAFSAPFQGSWHARSAERYAVPVQNRPTVTVNLCGKLPKLPNCVRMGCSNIGQNLPVTLHCSPEFSARLCADFSFWNCFFGFFSVLAPP